MAEMTLDLDLGPMMRKGMISGLADLIDALPQYRLAVILELLTRDDVARVMLMEALGEQALLERALDEQNQAAVDSGAMPEGSYTEKTWDEIATQVIKDLQGTPGGRGEC